MYFGAAISSWLYSKASLGLHLSECSVHNHMAMSPIAEGSPLPVWLFPHPRSCPARKTGCACGAHCVAIHVHVYNGVHTSTYSPFGLSSLPLAGKNCAEVSSTRLAELNSYVRLEVLKEELTDAVISKFQV